MVHSGAAMFDGVPRIGIALCALVGSVAVLAQIADHPLVTVLIKGPLTDLMHYRDDYYIPHNQCSGLIVMPYCPVNDLVAVSVEAHDWFSHPEVFINKTLTIGYVIRHPSAWGSCDGDAYVKFGQTCSGAQRRFSRSVTRKSLPPVG